MFTAALFTIAKLWKQLNVYRRMHEKKNIYIILSLYIIFYIHNMFMRYIYIYNIPCVPSYTDKDTHEILFSF